MIGDGPHRLIQGAIRPPGHHVDADRPHIAVHGRPLQRPHPVDQRVLGAANGGRRRTSTATTDVTARRRSISASANSVSSSVENPTTIAAGGNAARGANVPVVLSNSSPASRTVSSTR